MPYFRKTIVTLVTRVYVLEAETRSEAEDVKPTDCDLDPIAEYDGDPWRTSISGPFTSEAEALQLSAK